MFVINKLAEPAKRRAAGKRAAYVAPELRVFGPVGALTQAGSIGMTEGGGNPSLDRQPMA